MNDQIAEGPCHKIQNGMLKEFTSLTIHSGLLIHTRKLARGNNTHTSTIILNLEPNSIPSWVGTKVL